MLTEINTVKRFLGAKFGYGETLEDGVYAVPTTTSKGKAFMRFEIVDGKPSGSNNFKLFWDEQLTLSWYDNEKPDNLNESKFAKAFRQLDNE